MRPNFHDQLEKANSASDKEKSLEEFRKLWMMPFNVNEMCPTLNEIVEKDLHRPFDYIDFIIDLDLFNKVSFEDFKEKFEVEAYTRSRYYVCIFVSQDKKPIEMLNYLLKGE